jgi:fibronectin type 3 domain-containing protein
VQATASSTSKFKVTWSWSPAVGGLGIARFNVYCGTSSTGEPEAGSSTSDSYTYTKAVANTKYYCYVVAVDTGNDDSPDSATATVTTPPVPNAPTNVTATANSATNVTVTWSETIPKGGLAISNYKIYRSTSLPVTTADPFVTRTTTSYTDTTVVGATTYYYAISANDTGGDASPLSAPASVTTP